MLSIDILAPSDVVARNLLGCHLVREYKGNKFIGKIVETEAYHPDDAASHSFKGETPRTKVLFGPSGHAYVYFTYGMHYCMNVVTGPEGEGSAVLIRAVEPIAGAEQMMQLRPVNRQIDLTNGPAKLCQAMAIDMGLDGHNLSYPPLRLLDGEKVPAEKIVVTSRIGISKAKDVQWRFYVKGNPSVSHPNHV